MQIFFKIVYALDDYIKCKFNDYDFFSFITLSTDNMFMIFIDFLLKINPIDLRVILSDILITCDYNRLK